MTNPFDIQSEIDGFYAAFPDRKQDTFFINLETPIREALDRLRQTWGARAGDSGIQHLSDMVRYFYKHDSIGALWAAPVPYSRDLQLWTRTPHSQPSYGLISAANSQTRKSFARGLLTDYFNNYVPNNIRAILPPARAPDESVFQNDEWWRVSVFDHECAHMIVRFMDLHDELMAHPFPFHAEECFADLYAVLRHYARFGTDTGFDEAMVRRRALLTVLMGTSDREGLPYATDHMTAICLAALAAYPDRESLARLTPAQAAQVAADLTRAHCLGGPELDRLSTVMRDGLEKMKAEGLAAYAGWLADEAPVPPTLARDFLRAAQSFWTLPEADAAALHDAEERLVRRASPQP